MRLFFAFLTLYLPAMAIAADDYHGDVIHHTEKHAKAGLPQLDPTWFSSQIFWTILTFIAFYTVVSRAIIPALAESIETRNEHIQRDLESARQMKEEAEDVHQEYERMMEEARSRVASFYEEADQKVKKRAEKKITSFQARAHKTIKEVEEKIADAMLNAKKDIHLVIEDTAVQTVEKVANIKVDAKSAQSILNALNEKKVA